MKITRTQWDAIASFSISMHSVFFTEENPESGLLTIDRVIENGQLQGVFDAGLTLDELKTYMEFAVKKGGGKEYDSLLSHYIPDFKLILERFETVKKSGGARVGAGRKKSERPLEKVTVRIFADQQPITDSEIRDAIDTYLSSRRA